MTAPTRRVGGAGSKHRPPPKIFLGIGATLFLLNHLSVVFGAGLQPEAVMTGSWLVLMGGWVQLAGRSFDAVWGWADPSDRRMLGLALLTLVLALAIAETVAWFAYGRHLLG